MRDLLAAQRYAQAFFNIVVSQQMDGQVERELETFSESLKSSSDLQKFFESPRFKLADKRKFLLRIYHGKTHEVYPILINFFTLLLEKNRFNLIHDIVTAFKKIADEFQGEGVAEIKTAHPLSHDVEKMIVAKLEKMAGYKITVNKIIDDSLIGGVLVRYKNKVIDGSVHNQVELMKKALTKIKTV